MRHTLLCFALLSLTAACDDGGGTTGSGTDTTDPLLGDDDDDNGGGGGVDLVECEQAFSPCGGDPTGTWNVGAVCKVEVDTSALGCGDLDYEITADRSSGTITMAAAGAYERYNEVDVDFLLHVPQSCLGGPVSCNNLAALSGGLLDECNEVPDDLCDCTGSLAETDSYSGTWTLEGSNVVVTDNDERTEFCVEGTRGETLHEDGSRVIWTR